MKFKVGDKVRIVCDERTGNAKREMKEVITRIDRIFEDREYKYSLKVDRMWLWRDGEFELVEPESKIERVIFNEPATIIFWKDGSKTISKCHSNDAYDREKGFLVAYLKHFVSASEIRSDMDKFIGEPTHCCEDKPLSTEEILQHDGQKLWLSSLNRDFSENFTDEFCGWHVVRVAKDKLISCKENSYYFIEANNVACGYRAYLKPQVKQ